MKRIGTLMVAVVITVTACGGSDETAPEPDVEVEAVDDDGAFRLAGVGQVINGCRIELNTRCPDANLSGAYLTGAYLARANLRGANLWKADLPNADLSGVNLSGADLRDANLRDANLRRADLWRADLTGADLRDANLSGANLSGADLSRARFCGTVMPDGKTRNDNC